MYSWSYSSRSYFFLCFQLENTLTRWCLLFMHDKFEHFEMIKLITLHLVPRKRNYRELQFSSFELELMLFSWATITGGYYFTSSLKISHDYHQFMTIPSLGLVLEWQTGYPFHMSEIIKRLREMLQKSLLPYRSVVVQKYEPDMVLPKW